MNEETLKDMPEYTKNLPKPVQDLVFDGVWEERTEEIAKKYSLSEKQTDDLINNVLYILVGLLKPEDFLSTITVELSISGLLAEQLVEDLEVRVFEYALKTIQNQEKKGESIEKEDGDDLPELRPEITPLIEPEEKVRVRPVPVGFTETTPQPALKPQMPKPELVQRPISVPRYTATPMEDTEPKPVLPPKEAAPHQSAPSTQTSASPQPVPEPVKKYAVDPYREPLD